MSNESENYYGPGDGFIESEPSDRAAMALITMAIGRAVEKNDISTLQAIILVAADALGTTWHKFITEKEGHCEEGNCQINGSRNFSNTIGRALRKGELNPSVVMNLLVIPVMMGMAFATERDPSEGVNHLLSLFEHINADELQAEFEQWVGMEELAWAAENDGIGEMLSGMGIDVRDSPNEG